MSKALALTQYPCHNQSLMNQILWPKRANFPTDNVVETDSSLADTQQEYFSNNTEGGPNVGMQEGSKQNKSFNSSIKLESLLLLNEITNEASYSSVQSSNLDDKAIVDNSDESKIISL